MVILTLLARLKVSYHGRPQKHPIFCHVELATPTSQDLLDQLDWAKQHDEDSARPSHLEL